MQITSVQSYVNWYLFSLLIPSYKIRSFEINTRYLSEYSKEGDAPSSRISSSTQFGWLRSLRWRINVNASLQEFDKISRFFLFHPPLSSFAAEMSRNFGNGIFSPNAGQSSRKGVGKLFYLRREKFQTLWNNNKMAIYLRNGKLFKMDKNERFMINLIRRMS